MITLPPSPSPAALKAAAPPRRVPIEKRPESAAVDADQAFYQRYVDAVPFGKITDIPAYTAFDSHSKKPVLLRCFRSHWDAKSLELAIQFGRIDSPFSLGVKDVAQRPTETVLVSNLHDFSIEEWVCTEEISESQVERFARQIGDWMMEWKTNQHSEVVLDFNSIRIGRTKAGKPFCRILGGNPTRSTKEAVSAMRTIIGSILNWNAQRLTSGAAPDVQTYFDETSSIKNLEIAPDSWLGWLMTDEVELRPPSIGDWLLGQDQQYRNKTIKRVGHHEMGPDSPWGELQP